MAQETPKGPSSRLLSMKFMQRAVASGSSTPESDAATSAKKRKTFHSPAQQQIDASINQASVQKALEERESKRLAALSQHSSKDTQWVLKGSGVGTKQGQTQSRPLRVVYVGYGDVGSSDDEDVPVRGRTSTKKATPKDTESPQAGSESEADSDNSSEGSEKRYESPKTPSGLQRSRSTASSKQSSESKRAKTFRDKRKGKEVKLSQLSSISAGGGKLCHKCNKPGHMMAECPQKGRGNSNKT